MATLAEVTAGVWVLFGFGLLFIVAALVICIAVPVRYYRHRRRRGVEVERFRSRALQEHIGARLDVWRGFGVDGSGRRPAIYDATWGRLPLP
jgi:hypothetical protein